MKKNVGTTDRLIRLILAAILGLLLLGGQFSGVAFWLALAVMIILAATGLIGYCGLYQLLGIKTCKI